MKLIELSKGKYVIEYTSSSILAMNEAGITTKSIAEMLENDFNVSDLYKCFWYGLRSKHPDMTLEEALKVIDDFYSDENRTIEDFQELVIGELCSAMGFGKMFREKAKKKKKK